MVALIARDMDDLTALAALMQDALTVPTDLHYDRRAHRFAGVFSRFVWEDMAQPRRIRAGFHLDGVTGVRQRNIQDREILNLLAIQATGDDNAGWQIDLVFSDDAEIRLSAECLEIHLKDIGAPWTVSKTPRHGG